MKSAQETVKEFAFPLGIEYIQQNVFEVLVELIERDRQDAQIAALTKAAELAWDTKYTHYGEREQGRVDAAKAIQSYIAQVEKGGL